jgi:multiple sugar transport system substrate-binding protein
MKLPDLSRRSAIRGAAALGGAAAFGGLDGFAKAWAQAAPFKPEAGAKLNVLRWKRFVPAEDEAFVAMVNAFTKATGVEVNVTNESFEDIQPKASVAANTGQGPDIVWGLHSLPHLFPDKLLEVGDVADYLGKKYGGWVPAGEETAKSGGKWVSIPVAFNGGYINYRKSAVEKAGFKGIPTDFPGFLELLRALKKNNTPSGFALGHATGDGNAWTHWVLWSHGAYLIDKDDKVIINSDATVKALEYAKSMYETFIPGTVSWNDSNNNKAYLAGELYLTANGISIYAAAKAGEATDARLKDIAADTEHALFPIGPIGKPAELQLCFPIMAFKYSKTPNAAKAFMAFMMEAENMNPWLMNSVGYLTHTLNAYDANPVWTADPKRIVFRDAGKRTLTAAGIGKVGEKPAAAIAEFIVVDMFANFCTGREDAKGAMKLAERQAQRLFR